MSLTKSNRIDEVAQPALQKSHVNGFARECFKWFKWLFKTHSDRKILNCNFNRFPAPLFGAMSKLLNSPEFWVFVPLNSSSRSLHKPIEIAPIFHFRCCCLAGWSFNENKPQIGACHSLTNILSEVKQLKIIFPLECTREFNGSLSC